MNVMLIEEHIRIKREKECEKRRIKALQDRYKSRLRQKVTCNKCKAYSQNKCIMGYKEENGKPLEPCVKPERKYEIKDFMEIKSMYEEVH